MADIYLTLKPKNQKISHVWRTSIQKSVNGKEKRTALFTWPRIVLNNSFDIVGERNINWLKRNLVRFVDRIWGIPIWQDITFLTSPAFPGQNSLSVEQTSNRHFYVGRRCIIIHPLELMAYELGTILNLTPTSITLVSNLNNGWIQGAMVMPLLDVRISATQSVSSVIKQYQTFDLEATEAFEVERDFAYTVPSSGAITYRNLDLFLQRFPEPASFGFNRNYELLQFLGKGYTQSRYNSGENTLTMKNTLIRTSREDIWDTFKFFDSKQGRLSPFWIPSWVHDIIVISPFQATDSVLHVEDIKYTIYYLPNEVIGRHIYIQFYDSTYVCRKIIAATASTITLDSPIGKNVTIDNLPFLLVSFLNLCRFDIDTITSDYTLRTMSSFELSFIGLVEESV